MNENKPPDEVASIRAILKALTDSGQVTTINELALEARVLEGEPSMKH